MFARIYKPAKTAMQSGQAKSRKWRLEFDAESARRIDPLMGWTSADDMAANQVLLNFESLEDAVAYAKDKSIPYRVEEAAARVRHPKAYADNFAFKRRKPWTH